MGFIRKVEILRNSLLTIRLYGVRIWVLSLTARNTTFLDILIREGKI